MASNRDNGHRDLSIKNPLLAVLSPEKVTGIKGRPRKMATFTTDEIGIFESSRSRGIAIMRKKTKSTTKSLGSKAGDKPRATTASTLQVPG
jgi:hypothetical protein